MSTQAWQATRGAIYHAANKRWTEASGIGDVEAVLGEVVQDPTRVVEEFDGLITGIDDGRGDLQVRQSVDIDVGYQGRDRQAGGSGDSGRRDNEGD